MSNFKYKRCCQHMEMEILNINGPHLTLWLTQSVAWIHGSPAKKEPQSQLINCFYHIDL